MNYNRHNFKLTFINDETKFFVNEHTGIVTCVLYGILKSPIPNSYNYCALVPEMGFKGVGIAKCKKSDIFDVERGKRIALARAENKAYLNALGYLNEKATEFTYFLNAIEKFGDKTFRCCAHNEDYIDSLSYDAHPNYVKDLKPLKHNRD